MPLPNFFVVGAVKAGTTSLHNYLKQHPDVALPSKKETFFLTGLKFKEVNEESGVYHDKIIPTFDEYQALFPTPKKAIGEICAGYLYFHNLTIPRIHHYCGAPKIIIILRNPVDRAYSNYMHHIRDLKEPLSFEEALEAEALRAKNDYWWGFQYREIGLYSEQVNAYLQNFSSVKVILFEDLISHSGPILNEICDFLEIEHYNFKTASIYNKSGTPKNKYLQHFLTEQSKLKEFLKKIYRPIVPRRLEDYFYFKVKNLNVGKKNSNKAGNT